MINAPDERAEVLASGNALLKEIISQEPEVLLILKTVALFTASRDRWEMYSELKRRFLPLVGFYADKPELATHWHYEAMIDAIDALLPQEREP